MMAAAVEQEAGTPGGADWTLKAATDNAAADGAPSPELGMFATPTPQTARRLASLTGHEDAFQVDSFNRALLQQKGGTSTAGKLTALFKSKIASRTGGGAGGGGSGTGAVGKSPGGGGGSFTGGTPPAPMLSADELLQWSNEPIPTSLLRLPPEYALRAVKMFAGVLRYCGDVPLAQGPPPQALQVETAQKLLHQGLKRPELRDELYMQLVKQTRGNPCPESRARAWGLFHLVAAAMPPSKDFTALISEYVHTTLQDMGGGEGEGGGDDCGARAAAAGAWSALKRSTKCGARRSLPTVEEIAAHLSGRRLAAVVFFLDETFEELSYDVTTSVAEAIEQLAGLIRLTNFQTFSLYQALRPVNGGGGGGASSKGGNGGGGAVAVAAGPGSASAAAAQAAADAAAALPYEHLLLDDTRYIADVVAELRNPRLAREGYQSRLLFKKRMFRETDEAINEPQFVALSFVQAQHDYLAGNYPVVRDDAAQMAALQMAAEFGPSLLDDAGGAGGSAGERIDAAGGADGAGGGADNGSDGGNGKCGGNGGAVVVTEAFKDAVERFVTQQVLASRPRQEWLADIAKRYKVLAQHGKDDARLQFMRILRSLPYGNSMFFSVRRMEDPIGLLPPRLVLGINKRGVHFFRPVPKEYLHSAELRDIMQFGSSTTAIFFKMRVAGVLHIFQFETRQGDDICMALQTHINDIMMRRYSRVKAASDARGGGGSSGGASNAGGGNAGADGGGAGGAGGAGAAATTAAAAHAARLEARSKEAQAALEQARAQLQDLQTAESAARRERDALAAELADLREQLAGEAAARGSLQGRLSDAERALAEARAELDLARAAAQAASAAQGDAAQVEHARLAELEALLDAKQRELDDARAGAGAAARAAELAASQRDALERKVARLERAGEAEVKGLREEYEAAVTELRSQLQARNASLQEATDAAAHAAAQVEEMRAEVEAARADAAEVEELRELRRDVQRREAQQAAIIESQARRIDELDRLYQDEVMQRKRAHNALQDAKGKIRVFCRVRPMLGFEAERQQAPAVSVPNELTVAHPWRGEPKPREYDFDAVFGPDAPQEAVFEDARHLVRSALDGYNVCVFAYGQTGSGKTFTIYGSKEQPGLAPRAVQELFKLADRDAGKATYAVRLQMLELYQDQLQDLLLQQQQHPHHQQQHPHDGAGGGGGRAGSAHHHGGGGGGGGNTPPSSAFAGGGGGGFGQQQQQPPRLEIKKDPKGLVTVLGATTLPVAGAAQLMAAIEAGLARRRTGSTQMNHESSRSHLVISLLLEGTNLQTQAATRGKISFVDLAGSERVKKSGSTGEGLKEAQAINKSLSALGDVISALASEQPHIPYRNHKLTMLMSDCLGGNAKALMFVNVSPTDANLDESQNSLQYATRVRTIKNNALRDEAGKEVLRLRRQVEVWKERAGLASAFARAAADAVDVTDERRPGTAGNDGGSGAGAGAGAGGSDGGGSRPSTAASRGAASSPEGSGGADGQQQL